MFINPYQLHMTVLMLDLTDPRRFDLAVKVLKSLESEIQMNVLGAHLGLEPTPVNLQFKGLNSHQKKTKVIYCDLERNEGFKFLQRIAHCIIDKFLSMKVV